MPSALDLSKFKNIERKNLKNDVVIVKIESNVRIVYTPLKPASSKDESTHKSNGTQSRQLFSVCKLIDPTFNYLLRRRNPFVIVTV